MKKLFPLLFLASYFSSHARIGMGDIQFETPGGHTICFCDLTGDKLILVAENDTIFMTKQWYFYNNHIVGKEVDDYFIFNETTDEVRYFSTEESWQQTIAAQNLSPFYTRWLTVRDSPDNFLFGLFLWSFVLIPLLIIALVVVIVFSFQKKIIWNRRTWLFTLGLFLVVALYFAYKLNTDSF